MEFRIMKMEEITKGMSMEIRRKKMNQRYA